MKLPEGIQMPPLFSDAWTHHWRGIWLRCPVKAARRLRAGMHH